MSGGAANNLLPDAVVASDEFAQRWRQVRPMVTLAATVMLGIMLGSSFLYPLAWLTAAGAIAVWMIVAMMRKRWRVVRYRALLAAMLMMASWAGLRTQYVSDAHIGRFAGSEPQLAQVTGRIVSEPRLSTPMRGPFGAFSYETPGTLAVLQVHTVTLAGKPTPAAGNLLMRVDDADHRLQAGQLIRARGWLAAIAGPLNPGELDYKQILADQDIVGRLTLRSRGNWTLLEPASWQSPGLLIDHVRREIARAMRQSLHMGMTEGTAELGLLDALLLGRWDRELEEVHEAFRRVGLAHLLSISGAHLAILLGLAWLIVRLFIPHPPRAALVLLVILGLYLLAVPLRVPIVRAAIMAGIFFAGYASGRGLSGLGSLALAAVLVLVWRPADLFSPGFQLSFGVVAALLLFAEPVSQWMWPRSEIQPIAVTLGEQLARLGVDYLAVSVVAFAVAMPVVAYHFQMISPLAVLLSVLALPVVTALLGLGYLKMLLGLVMPSGSVALAGPLGWMAETMVRLVQRASDWPGAAIELSTPPTVMWVAGTLAVVLATLAGRYRGRRLALGVSAAIVLGWGVWLQQPGALAGGGNKPALWVNMIAVGDGSCYLVRIEGDQPHTLMFDCGSQGYLDVGSRSIVPALRRLGVKRIDTLVLSHADLDHYCGSLDVAAAMPIGRIWAPPQLLAEAQAHPRQATAYLVRSLADRGLVVTPTARGHAENIGSAKLEILWPTPDFAPKWANDTSIVLSLRIAGIRLILNGDIQQQAIPALLAAEPNLHADITDLPHHGSMVDASADWLSAVSPRVLLQSTGPARLRNDKWLPVLAGRDITRLISNNLGMVELRVSQTGQITWTSFR